jgi:hypothetical protein
MSGKVMKIKLIINYFIIPLGVIFIFILLASCILNRDFQQYTAAIDSLSVMVIKEDSLINDTLPVKPTGYILSDNGVIPNITVTDLINNIDRHLILYEIFIGLIVGILGILIPVVSFVNINKVEKYVEREIGNMRAELNSGLQANEARINSSEAKVRSDLATNLESVNRVSDKCEKNTKDDLREMRSKLESDLQTLRTELNKEKIEGMVDNFISNDVKLFNALNEVLEKHYKERILEFTLDYNKQVIGNLKEKDQAIESILRSFSKSVINSIDDEEKIIKKEDIKKALDQFNTDWLILNKLFSLDTSQIRKGLSDYINVSKNPIFYELLVERQKHYNHNLELHGLLAKAVQISRPPIPPPAPVKRTKSKSPVDAKKLRSNSSVK